MSHRPVGVHGQKLCNCLAWICQNRFGGLWLCHGLFICPQSSDPGNECIVSAVWKIVVDCSRRGEKPPEKPHCGTGLGLTGLVFCECDPAIKPLPHFSSHRQVFGSKLVHGRQNVRLNIS